MPNLPMSVLTVPTEIEGEVVPTSYEIKDATARAGAVELVKDTAGWLGKNRLVNNATSGTSSGVTRTVNNNKSISLNGTSESSITGTINTFTGSQLKAMGDKLVLSGGISSDIYIALRLQPWSIVYADRGNGVLIDTSTLDDAVTYYVSYAINQGINTDGKVFHPMICDADIYALSPSYEPYHDTVEAELAKKANAADVTAIAEVIPSSATSSNKVATAQDVTATVDLMKDTTGWLGKNLIKCDIDSLKADNTIGTWSGNVYTLMGVTYTPTFTEDGYLKTVIVNGENSSSSNNSDFQINRRYYNSDNLGKATILNGCPNTIGNKGRIGFRVGNKTSGTFITVYEDKGSGVNIPVLGSNEDGGINITIFPQQSVSNLEFYPMLRDASILDQTFEPYHKSVEDWYWNNNAKTGVHNFLNTEKFETGEKNGITATLRADKGISLTGTPTIQSGTIFFRNYGTILKAGTYKYKLNKYPKGSCIVGINDSVSGLGNYKILATLVTNMTEISFAVTDEDLASKPYVFCELGVSYNAGNIDEVYYPQILLNEDTFGGFMPFTMTNEQLTEKVFDKEIVLDGVDLDNIDKTGLYYLRGKSVTNLPADITPAQLYAPMLVLKNLSNSDVRQVIYRHNGTIYLRGKSGSPSIWGSWYKFTGTVVS